MKDKFFSDVTTSKPPAELRDQILRVAANQIPFVAEPSLIDRCWNSRAFWWSWSAAVLALGVLLISWNPPIPEVPGTEPSMQTSIENELLEVDPTLMSQYLRGSQTHREQRR